MDVDVQASKDVNSNIICIFLNEGLARMNEDLARTGEGDLIEG
jgi:hypothetical protein